MRHPIERSGDPEAKVSDQSPRPRRRFILALFFSACLAVGLTVASPASAKGRRSSWWKGRSFTRNPVVKNVRTPGTLRAVKPRAVGQHPAHGAVVRPVPPAPQKKPAPPSK